MTLGRNIDVEMASNAGWMAEMRRRGVIEEK
jgi:hypothetical protein